MKYFLVICSLLCILSCSTKPRPVVEGEDACTFCKMNISDKKYAWETISETGKIFVFDDVVCLQNQMEENEFSESLKSVFVTDFMNPETLLSAESAFYFSSQNLNSPMGGNVAAFSNTEDRDATSAQLPGENISYEMLIQK